MSTVVRVSYLKLASNISLSFKRRQINVMKAHGEVHITIHPKQFSATSKAKHDFSPPGIPLVAC